nr:bifunctional adenosylcobinamide kinase/adenosylcobinamide-phosphate guanylyltransferase [Streptococcus suis]
MGRYFRDLLGQVNQYLAKEASEVYLVICGLAQRLK